MFRLVCPSCGISCDGQIEPQNVPAEDLCPTCRVAMQFADPAAAVLAITQAANKPKPRVPAWQVFRREVLIGLAWGIGLAVLVVYPLSIRPAYRDSDGQIWTYPPHIQHDAAGNRVFLPGTAPLSWSEWLTLSVQQCGTVIIIACSVGAIVATAKLALRHHATNQTK